MIQFHIVYWNTSTSSQMNLYAPAMTVLASWPGGIKSGLYVWPMFEYDESLLSAGGNIAKSWFPPKQGSLDLLSYVAY